MKKIIIYTDGGSRNNPGIAGAGVFIADENGNELKKAKKFLGIKTNNWAEYEALIIGLEKAKYLLGSKINQTEVEVRMDSQLIVRQINGEYRVKEPSLFEQFVKVNNLKVNFPHIKFVHIPRAENKEADKLANEAMDKQE
ncbi:ribonuclease HI family protein [Patescibacteria group bacterium]|nr:ribonuclease HI family protein [Patescibacteria group bacterium]MCG2695238.1 ribonuclease HI family protein [Candidatus Parcubacteria bacterium]